MVGSLAFDPEDGAEATGVAEAQHHAVLEAYVDMIMLLARRRLREGTQAAAHPEMHDERIVCDAEQEILAAPLDPIDSLSDQTQAEVGGNRPAKAVVVDAHARHFLPLYVRRDAATGRFDFGEFRHESLAAGCCCAEYTPRCNEPRGPDPLPGRKKADHMKRNALVHRVLAMSLLAAALGLAFTPSIAAAAEPSTTTPPPATAASGESELTAELMYKLLVGDIALQRDEPALAARAFFEAARSARDPALARRATEVALFARQRALALESARLWVQVDPTSERAQQLVVSLAQAGTSNGDLKSELERLLAESAANGGMLGDAFLQLNRALSKQADKIAVYRLVTELAKPYATVPEAHFAVAFAGLNTGLTDGDIAAASLREAETALELRPGWDRAALLKADILSRNTPDLAVRYLRDFLARQPGSRPVAASLAQMLIEQKRYEEARAVFQKLLEADPSARDLQFAVAGISVQMKDYATAERIFKELQAADYGEPGAVLLYLAQIAEETKHYDEAIARYREVTTGDRAWAAKLRIAAVMGKKGQIDEARRYLNALPTDGDEQKTEVVQAEAQLLREAGDYKGASTVLGKALADSPDSTDLLYDAAMIAEKLDRIDEAEARLKRVIELKPNNAQALNALGYTLVDRTPRAAEGLKFIEQAHALAPDDPFILDSMGWAYYRIGNIDDSEKYLRQAMAQRPDAEIAAHLGEVLWAKGERAGATDIWQSQLKQNPDNPVLLETVRRLSP